MKYKTPVSLVLAASALLMLGAVLPSVAADGQSTYRDTVPLLSSYPTVLGEQLSSLAIARLE